MGVQNDGKYQFGSTHITMGVTTEEDVLKKLESLSLSTKPSSSSKLNIAFRDSLRDFAKSQDYSYAVRAEPTVGMAYIWELTIGE